LIAWPTPGRDQQLNQISSATGESSNVRSWFVASVIKQPTWIEHGIGESNPTLFEFAPVTAAGLAPRSPQRDRSFGPRQADTAIQVVPALNAGRRHNLAYVKRRKYRDSFRQAAARD
jgi:hypothetical protein